MNAVDHRPEVTSRHAGRDVEHPGDCVVIDHVRRGHGRELSYVPECLNRIVRYRIDGPANGRCLLVQTEPGLGQGRGQHVACGRHARERHLHGDEIVDVVGGIDVVGRRNDCAGR